MLTSNLFAVLNSFRLLQDAEKPPMTGRKFLPNPGGIIRTTNVIVGTANQTYTGQIIHFDSERLLDVLNQGSSGDQPDLPADFIHLQNVQISSLKERTNSISPQCFIAKRGILFAGEILKAVGRSIVPDLPRLFVSKQGIDVEIYLQSFLVTGQVYVERWQRLIGMLNDDRRFIPVTNAIVSSIPNTWTADFDFIAVNRKQISSIATTEEPNRAI